LSILLWPITAYYSTRHEIYELRYMEENTGHRRRRQTVGGVKSFELIKICKHILEKRGLIMYPFMIYIGVSERTNLYLLRLCIGEVG
jgi:hypothetical protein